MIEDNKGVSSSSKTKTEGQCNDQKKKNKQWHRQQKREQHKPSIKLGMNNSVAHKGMQFLFNIWHPLCYPCYQPGDSHEQQT